MEKSKARAQQFFTRSGSEATKGSRKGYGLLGGGEDVVAQLTPEQKRNNMVTRMKWLRLMRDNSGLTTVEADELRELQKEYKRLQPTIRAKQSASIPQCFVDVCRDTLTHAQFKLIMNRAIELARTRDNGRATAQGTAGHDAAA